MTDMSGLSSKDERSHIKTCLDCRESKPLDAFSPSPRGVGGRNSYCKICMRERSKASYRKRRARQGKVVRELRSIPDGMKRCPDCQTTKPMEAFPRNRADRTGRGTYCKPCHNVRTRANIQKNHGNTRNYHLKGRYGLSGEEYDQMIAAQGGLCAVCRKAPAQHVDHDHRTQLVRGLLCSCCNQALGNARDDIAVLRSMVEYLHGSRGVRHQAPFETYKAVNFDIEWVPAFLHARSS